MMRPEDPAKQALYGFSFAFGLEGGVNYFIVYFLNNVNIIRNTEPLQQKGVIGKGVDTELASQYIEWSGLFFELDIFLFFIILFAFRRFGAFCYLITWSCLTLSWLLLFSLTSPSLWYDWLIGSLGGVLFLLVISKEFWSILLSLLKTSISITTSSIKYIAYIRFLR